MRATAKVFTLASVALLSCRAVLGIEEIEEGSADGGTGTTDAAADSVGTDSANVTETSVDSGPDGCAAAGQMCGKCCRDSNMFGNKELEDTFKPCLCDGGCTECASTTLCGGGADPKTSGCIPCIDQVIWTQKCPKERTQCQGSANCKSVLECIDSCN